MTSISAIHKEVYVLSMVRRGTGRLCNTSAGSSATESASNEHAQIARPELMGGLPQSQAFIPHSCSRIRDLRTLRDVIGLSTAQQRSG